MVTNNLDYMYEGYGYDMDNQLLYTSVTNYDEALTEDTKMSTKGMETLSYIGVVGYDDALETEKANEYTELGQFVGENGANYTDLRQSLCACGGDAKNATNWPAVSVMSDDIMNVGVSNSPIEEVEAKEEASNNVENTQESGSTQSESGETVSTSGSSQPIVVEEEEEP